MRAPPSPSTEPGEASAGGLERRDFLKLAAGGVAAAAGLWIPRRARGGQPTPVRRVVLINLTGGVRWTASFDAQSDIKSNPWGVLPWSVVGRGAAPSWGFSRALLQRPLVNPGSWSTEVIPSLTSDDPAHYNVAQLPLAQPGWNGAKLPSFADLASSVTVVRVTGNPGGAFDGDHGSASASLFTGSVAGTSGIATIFNYGLREQLGSSYDSLYPIRAVSVSQPAFAAGAGATASARPMFLNRPTYLPRAGSSAPIPAWARAAETELDVLAAAKLQGRAAQILADYQSDKSNEQYVKALINPALDFAAELAPGVASPELGKLLAGGAPVTNDMLAEVFGLSSAITPPGDVLFDLWASIQQSETPTWSILGDDINYGVNSNHDNFGVNGALAVRLLQLGSPVVTLAVGNFDTHSEEVVGDQTHPIQILRVTRLLSGLAFALKAIEDPTAPGKSLWDSTVIFLCSEFGRGGPEIGANGFNDANGRSGGGSDHDMRSAWPMLGGPIEGAGGKGGGRLVSAPDGGGYYHQNRIYTTLMQGMGITDPYNPLLPYGTFAPIPGLLGGSS